MRKTASILLMILACMAASVRVPAFSGSQGGLPEEQSEAMMAGETEYSEEPVEEGLLRIGLSEPVTTMDIHKTSSEYMIPLNIYERLFEIEVDADGDTWLVSSLAENFTVSEDGKTYSFELRDNAFFSDGTKVKASDVAFTFARMLSLPGSVQTDFADIISGAAKTMMGATEVPEGIRVLDDSHLQITLSEPFEGYIYQLASPSCSILSESFVKEAGDDYGSCAEMTMGSGPYRVTAFSENEISLEKNPYYQCRENETLSASKVKLQVLPPALMYQKFQEGGLDILDTNMINPDAVNDLVHMDQYADRIVYRSSVTIQYLMMNMQSPLLKDIRIRKAIQMAIDRKGILDELYGGAGSLIDGIYPKGLFGFCEENQGWLSYDPEEAKRLIAEVPDAGKIPVELAANYQNSARRLTILEMIQQDLNDVGLRADIVSYDGDTMMYLRRNSSLMLYIGEWSADFNDPDNFIYTLFGSREKTYSRSSNFQVPSVFARIQKARGIQDREQRMQEYADLERILVQENAVWVPLFSTEHLFVLGDRVESFSPFWAGWSSMYFRDVVLKEGK